MEKQNSLGQLQLIYDLWFGDAYKQNQWKQDTREGVRACAKGKGEKQRQEEVNGGAGRRHMHHICNILNK